MRHLITTLSVVHHLPNEPYHLHHEPHLPKNPQKSCHKDLLSWVNSPCFKTRTNKNLFVICVSGVYLKGFPSLYCLICRVGGACTRKSVSGLNLNFMSSWSSSNLSIYCTVTSCILQTRSQKSDFSRYVLQKSNFFHATF
jgi:hypothetical protein